MNVNSVSLLFCALLSLVICNKTDVEYQCSKNIVTIEDEKPIENLAEYCKDQPCISKCCKLHEILIKDKVGAISKCDNAETYGITYDYDKEILIYDSSYEENAGEQPKLSTKTFKDFHLVQNKIIEKSCATVWKIKSYYIRDNGYVNKEDPSHYCIDGMYKTEDKILIAVILLRHEEFPEDPSKFGGITSLISAVFLVLVFAVYCLLPQLRTMPGLLQMTYVAALFLSFTMKACIELFKGNPTYCFVVFSLYYFGFLCSFFWVNIMSFDIWWTFRAQRYQRAIHRQGILAKYGWYSVCGWGMPVLMTMASIGIDLSPSLPSYFIKPSFKSNMNTAFTDRLSPVMFYLLIPVGVLTMINILLFLMTIYNIWLINREISKIGSNTKNNNRFLILIKLSLMMGTSWILELVQIIYKDMPKWVDNLVSAYDSLMGLVIFIIFICNKTTLRLLCRRFNIKCRFITQERKVNPSARSTATNNGNGSYCRTKSSDSDIEIEGIEEVSIDPRHDKK